MVLAESPSYVGALGTFQSYQTEVVHIACDSEGLIPEALTETAERPATGSTNCPRPDRC